MQKNPIWTPCQGHHRNMHFATGLKEKASLFFMRRLCNQWSGESQDKKQAKTKRFHVVAREDIYKYDLLADLAEFTYLKKKLMSYFISPSSPQ